MESFLWALNLVAVCLLCAWALREDSRPPDSPDDAKPPASRGKAGPAATARQQGRQPTPRK